LNILVAYSIDSIPTTVTAYAGDKLATILEEKGHNVTKLSGLMTNRLAFQLQMALKRADMICYLGHGTKDKLIGQLPMGLLVPMVSLANRGLLVASVVHTVACLSGAVLGRRSLARAYYGSTDYMFVAYPDAEHNWLEDFTDTWLTIPLFLSEGSTDYIKALNLYKEKCTKYIKEYEKHPEWHNGDAYIHFLQRNRDGYTVYIR